MKRPWRRFSFLGCSNDLGYKDSQIKAKETLETIAVSRGGRKTEKYKPDFALTVKGAPRCIIDAKAIRESPVEWVSQCSGYCLALNQRYPAKNPVKFFVLSNGIKTLVYQWDNAEPINDLDFSDFEYGNPKYERLKKLLSAKDIISASSETLVHHAQFILTRPTSERARQLFSQCHKAIWKTEVRSPSGAFMAFVKVMFVKLWADKRLRQNPATSDYFKDGKESVSLPASAVVFSERWITDREEEGAANAIDTILFERLREEIEREIHAKKKKRIFSKGERIGLRSHTVRDVVIIKHRLLRRLIPYFCSSLARPELVKADVTCKAALKAPGPCSVLHYIKHSIWRMLICAYCKQVWL